MKYLKYIIILLCILCMSDGFAITKAKSSRQTEALEYDVYYHWGIIWKKAGQGVLNLYEEKDEDGAERMHGKITGKTLSFIEYIMSVRDTLECWYTPEHLPIEFVKKTNEGSYKAIERNFYNYSYKNSTEKTANNIEKTTVKVDRWRNKKGDDTKTYESQEVVYDMLSAFYMVRSLDFDNMTPGTKIQFPVVAGIKMQKMSVKYINKSTTKLRNGKKIQAFKVEMAINTKGEDGAPLYVWLSTDKSHKPLNVIIQLRRIGAIQCELAE